MKTFKVACLSTLSLFALHGGAFVYAQGSLTPPGAPAPTMKTLDQVEPRTPIPSGSYIISQPGSYYLTANQTSSIQIAADDVTLDLMGFRTEDGIIISGNRRNLRVCNGTITSTETGIDAQNLEGGHFEDLRIVDNPETGIAGGSDCMIEHCTFARNGSFAILSGSNTTIKSCRITDTVYDALALSGSGSVVSDNVIMNNGAKGIDLLGAGNQVSRNIVKGNGDNYALAQGNQLDLILSEIPESIDWSASVKLAGSLESTGNGVVITASGVTLDLMGFTISGDASDYGVFLDGSTNSAIRNVVVRNGIVQNFGYGVRAENAEDNRFEHLITTTNSSYGIHFSSDFGHQCNGNTLADCTINGNGGGVYLDGLSGQCDGNTIADCAISGNASSGIYLDGASGQCNGNNLANCTISDNGGIGVYLVGDNAGQCFDNTIANCTIMDNGSYGVILGGAAGQCNGNTLADCTISGNVGGGVYLTSSNGGECNGNVLADCRIRGNGSKGVNLRSSSGHCNGNTLTYCAISGNSSYGVYLNGDSGQCDGNTIADCTIRENGVVGIKMYSADGNRVERNHITGPIGSSGYGISSQSSKKNLISRNMCVGHAVDFEFSLSDTYGPIVTSTGALPTTGAGAHPLANFSL